MSKGIRLHVRDVKVLELLADRRVETLNVLHERLWPDCHRKSAYNRLGALARAGYLEHVIRTDANPDPDSARPPSQHLYLLGPKAPTALRLRNRDTSSLVKKRLNGALIDHQLATNRVADWIGTHLLGEADVPLGNDRRTRPDGAYRAFPDEKGRDLVMVELDLGHYSKSRIIDKVLSFLDHPEARTMIIATPTERRADLVARWVRESLGVHTMMRLHIHSFGELQRGVVQDMWEGRSRRPPPNRRSTPTG